MLTNWKLDLSFNQQVFYRGQEKTNLKHFVEDINNWNNSRDAQVSEIEQYLYFT